jgi:hypothetical protein
MKFLPLFILFMMLLAFLGCSKDQENPVQPADNTGFLRINNHTAADLVVYFGNEPVTLTPFGTLRKPFALADTLTVTYSVNGDFVQYRNVTALLQADETVISDIRADCGRLALYNESCGDVELFFNFYPMRCLMIPLPISSSLWEKLIRCSSPFGWTGII